MAWQFQQAGSREGVKKAFTVFKHSDTAEAAMDAQQVEAVRGIVHAEIDAIDKEYTGCHLECRGSGDPHNRQFTVTVRPLKLAL